MNVFAQDLGPYEPDETIVVIGSKYQDIYVEPSRVFGETGDQVFNGDSQIFAYANMKKHLYDKNLSIYNKNNIKYAYEDCDYLSDALKCGIENNHWTLVTNIRIDAEQATINMLLYDEIGLVVGQSTVSKYKKVIYIRDIKTTTTTNSNTGRNYSLTPPSNCSGNSCYPGSISSSGGGVPGKQVISEENMPKKQVLPPQITDRDVNQAVMMLYLSIK